MDSMLVSGRGPVSDLAMVLMMSLISSSLGVKHFIKCNDRAKFGRGYLCNMRDQRAGWISWYTIIGM